MKKNSILNLFTKEIEAGSEHACIHIYIFSLSRLNIIKKEFYLEKKYILFLKIFYTTAS